MGIESARVCCFPKSSGLCGSQEEVLGCSQRAWLPRVQKETSSVPGWRSWAQAQEQSGTVEDHRMKRAVHENAGLEVSGNRHR